MKMTPWFPADVTPVHVGVYEVDDHDGMGGQWWAYWDGKKFCYRCHFDWQDAFDKRNEKTDCPALTSWRGLASPSTPSQKAEA